MISPPNVHTYHSLYPHIYQYIFSTDLIWHRINKQLSCSATCVIDCIIHTQFLMRHKSTRDGIKVCAKRRSSTQTTQRNLEWQDPVLPINMSVSHLSMCRVSTNVFGVLFLWRISSYGILKRSKTELLFFFSLSLSASVCLHMSGCLCRNLHLHTSLVPSEHIKSITFCLAATQHLMTSWWRWGPEISCCWHFLYKICVPSCCSLDNWLYDPEHLAEATSGLHSGF